MHSAVVSHDTEATLVIVNKNFHYVRAVHSVS